MCGFFLAHSFHKKLNFKKLEKSANLIQHRGPDQKKNFFNEFTYSKFFRLKILDLSDDAMQPMMDHNKRYLLLFNGEIYNFKELNISKLKNKINNKHSDTATLFKLLIKFGDKALDMIEGMFSFVFFDFNKKRILFGRDRFGMKPLFYYHSKEEIIFSSEIKPILNYKNIKSFNIGTVYDYFLKGSMDHNDQTFFENIKCLQPGEKGVFYNQKLTINRYWSIIQNSIKYLNPINTEKNLKQLLIESINKHLISDRKIGLFLSGGSDSTALAHLLAQKLKNSFNTYTYGFKNNDKFSEINKAEITINNLDIKNFSYEVTAEYVINNMEKMTNILESPFTSIRLFGLEALYKQLQKEDTKVIIEGDGGDEIFGGYDYNYFPYLLDTFKKDNLKIFNKLLEFAKLKKNSFNSQFEYVENLIKTYTYQYGSTSDGTPFLNVDFFNKDLLDQHIDENFFKDEFEKNFQKLQKLKKSQYRDIYSIKLPRALKYKDRISMHYGIETRIPFLDHKFAETSFNLNNNFKIKNLDTRYLFKKILRSFTKNKIKFKKTKFSIADPQTEWMMNDLKEFVNDNFRSIYFKKLDIFNHKQIIKNYEEFCNKKNNNSSFQLFQILSYGIFHKYFSNFN